MLSKKTNLTLILSITAFSFLVFLLTPNTSQASINFSNGYWSTSFENPSCIAWDQNDATLTCDGLSTGGGWTCDSAHVDAINTGGNMALESGGMGYRHYVYSQGVNGGSIQPVFPNTNEFWIRYYIRFQAGMSHQVLYKVLYIYGPNGGNAPNVNQDNFGYYEQQGSTHAVWYSNPGTGWNGWFGTNQPSDGAWHEMEYHLKLESTPGAKDGILQVWDDDVLVTDEHGVEHGTGGFTSMLIGSNIHNSGNSGCVPIDYDDIAIVNSSTSPYLKNDGHGNMYIGPINSTSIYQCNDGADNDSDGLIDYPNDLGCTSVTDNDETNIPADTIPPTISNLFPTNTLPQGTTETTISVATSENATCKYGTIPNTSYDSIPNTFSTTGATTHSITVTGLIDGNTYNYYLRCQDTSNNSNTTDTIISFSIANPSFIQADVNQDSNINTTDALLILRNTLGLSMTNTNWQTSATTGDVNCDGSVNLSDVTLLLRYSLGMNMDETGWCVAN